MLKKDASMAKKLMMLDASDAEKTLKQIADSIKSDNIIIMLHTEKCPHCRKLRPKFIETADLYADKGIQFIDTELSADPKPFGEEFDFRFVPTVIYYKDGKEKLRHVGDKTIDLLKKNIKDVFDIEI